MEGRKSRPSTIWEIHISMGLYSCIAVTCVVRVHTTDGCVVYGIYPSLFRFKSQFLEPIPSAISEITNITM